MALLEATGITKRFGGIVALSEVDVQVEEGEALGIVGPNGAGKSTLFDCLLGSLRPDAGSVVFAGVRLDRVPAFRRARMGIGRTFQRLELFGGMTPRQHVLVALRVHAGTGRLWRDVVGLGRPRREELDEAQRLLELVGLAAVADVPVDTLALGQGRLVELARALAGRPRLLVLDEPSSGLDLAERERLVAVLGAARAGHGAAVMMVEHDLEMVAAVAERLVVLDSGRVVADGATSEVLASAGVRRAYLGIDDPVAGQS